MTLGSSSYIQLQHSTGPSVCSLHGYMQLVHAIYSYLAFIFKCFCCCVGCFSFSFLSLLLSSFFPQSYLCLILISHGSKLLHMHDLFLSFFVNFWHTPLNQTYVTFPRVANIRAAAFFDYQKAYNHVPHH